MRICPNCHTENPTRASHCMNCGTQLVDGAELPEEVILRRELKESKETIELLKRSLADLQKQLENASDNTEFQALQDKANEYKRTISVLQAQIEKKDNEISKLLARIAECQKKNGGNWGYIFVALFIVAFLSLVVTGFYAYVFSNRIDSMKYDLRQKEIEIIDLEGNVSELEEKITDVEGDKNTVTNELNELNNTYPLIIKDIEVASLDSQYDTDVEYGSTIYAYNTRYLKLKVIYASMESRTIPLVIKLRFDDYYNDMHGIWSKKEKTYYVRNDEEVLEVEAFGEFDEYELSAGWYQIEIWFNDICLKSKIIRIY